MQSVMIAVGFLVVLLGLYYLYNYIVVGNASIATAETTRGVGQFLAGAVLTLTLVGREMGNAIGSIGDAIAMVPNATAELLIIGLGALGLSGSISLGPVMFVGIAVFIMLAAAAVRF
jgi:hypothetical protein